MSKGVVDPQVSSSKRTLMYIPIIHTQADMGDLGASVQRIKTNNFGRRRFLQSAELVDRDVAGDRTDRGTLACRAGKPVSIRTDCRSATMRRVSFRNWPRRAAETTSCYFARESRRDADGNRVSRICWSRSISWPSRISIRAVRAAPRRRQLRSAALLEKRDRYIAARINSTLQPGETGILVSGHAPLGATVPGQGYQRRVPTGRHREREAM